MAAAGFVTSYVRINVPLQHMIFYPDLNPNVGEFPSTFAVFTNVHTTF